jgi:hypothetical protein
VIQVIETTLLRLGKGTPDSPIRVITQYWSMDGKLLAQVDPHTNAEPMDYTNCNAGVPGCKCGRFV